MFILMHIIIKIVSLKVSSSWEEFEEALII
jgi:hypothetical protein